MKLEEFKALEADDILYDTILSKRKRRHIAATVLFHNKDQDSLHIISEGLEDDIPYRDHLLFEFMPEDKSALPFY